MLSAEPTPTWVRGISQHRAQGDQVLSQVSQLLLKAREGPLRLSVVHHSFAYRRMVYHTLSLPVAGAKGQLMVGYSALLLRCVDHAKSPHDGLPNLHR